MQGSNSAVGLDTRVRPMDWVPGAFCPVDTDKYNASFEAVGSSNVDLQSCVPAVAPSSSSSSEVKR